MKKDSPKALLSEKAYEEIKDMIIFGKLIPGGRISEASVADILGVSRTPVREALRRLSAEGYVNINPNSNFIVNQFTLKDAKEIFLIRSLIEPEASRIAASMQENKDTIVSAHETMMSVLNLSDNERVKEFSNCDVKFHQSIIELTGNGRLLNISTSLNDRQLRMFLSSQSSDDKWVDSCIKQHKYILEAILQNDSITAWKMAKDHVDYCMNLALSLNV